MFTKILFFLTFATVNCFAGLDPDVLVQLNVFGGGRGTPQPSGFRIFKNGDMQEFKNDQWTKVGNLTAEKISAVKTITDIIEPGELYTDPNQGTTADAQVREYFVKNSKGEDVLIAREAQKKSVMLRGGAFALYEILKGLKFLVGLTN